MSDYCNICNTRRPQGGTNHLILNYGELWLEYCNKCGEFEKLANPVTGEVKTIAELATSARASAEERMRRETCEFCGSDDMSYGGLCQTCATGHYA